MFEAETNEPNKHTHTLTHEQTDLCTSCLLNCYMIRIKKALKQLKISNHDNYMYMHTFTLSSLPLSPSISFSHPPTL